MKNTIKVLGVIALVAIIGFSMVACDLEEETTTSALDGVWDNGEIVITFKGSNATFTQINSGSWVAIKNSGNVNIGDIKIKNITESKDREWTAQELLTDLSWGNRVLILSSDGKTLGNHTPGFPAPTTTYTKK